MNSDRFRFFSSLHLESDLLVGISHPHYQPCVESVCREEQLRLYELLIRHMALHPNFATSLDPLEIPGDNEDIPFELKTMYDCAMTTGTGPMSSVAGLFAREVGRAIEKHTGAGSCPGEVKIHSAEVIVENGGDLYIRNWNDLVVVVHAGEVALSGKLGLVIPPGEWGICTSSGTIGHSFSMGKADAVTIVSRDTPLADAWATALANQVQGREDIRPLLDRVAAIPEILACVVIAGEEVGIRGIFETKILT